MAGISDDVENLRVNRDDFMHALTEVQPAFGVSEEELAAVIQNGIIHYDANIEASHLAISHHLEFVLKLFLFLVNSSRWKTVR